MLASVLAKPHQIEPSRSTLLDYMFVEVHGVRMITSELLYEIGSWGSEFISDIGTIYSEFSRRSASFDAPLA